MASWAAPAFVLQLVQVIDKPLGDGVNLLQGLFFLFAYFFIILFGRLLTGLFKVPRHSLCIEDLRCYVRVHDLTPYFSQGGVVSLSPFGAVLLVPVPLM